jgi:hypothetical protein
VSAAVTDDAAYLVVALACYLELQRNRRPLISANRRATATASYSALLNRPPVIMPPCRSSRARGALGAGPPSSRRQASCVTVPPLAHLPSASVGSVQPLFRARAIAEPPTRGTENASSSADADFLNIDRPVRVLVAGGGIAGLVLAVALLKKGLDVRIFEQDVTAIRGEGKYRGPIQVRYAVATWPGFCHRTHGSGCIRTPLPCRSTSTSAVASTNAYMLCSAGAAAARSRRRACVFTLDRAAGCVQTPEPSQG